MAVNREDKIKVREALVDSILSLMIKRGKFWLDEHRRVIDKDTGQIIFSSPTTSEEGVVEPIVLFQQDYQDSKKTALALPFFW